MVYKMKKEEFCKYVNLIITICTDYLMESITEESLINNLKRIIQKIEANDP